MAVLTPALSGDGRTTILISSPRGVDPISAKAVKIGDDAYEHLRSASASVNEFFQGNSTIVDEETLDTIIQTYDRLERLSDWDVNWDGCGAIAPNIAAIANAKRWITSFFEELQAHNRPLLRPNVTANVEEEIVFEWKMGSHRVSVYVTPHTVEYVRSWGMNIYDEMVDGDADSEQEREELWRFLAE